MEYTKQPIDYLKQIQTLKERGLIINDEKQALEQLQIISYFRLANYLRPMEQDKFTHVFKPNSTLENALNLYYFDKELRVLIFRAIQSIEIALPIIPVFGIAIFPICHNYPNACQKHG